VTAQLYNTEQSCIVISVSTDERGPGRPRSQEADAAILDAALELLIERGAQATSIEQVARRAGVTRATVYRRFPDKTRLLVATVEATYGDPPRTPEIRDVEHLLAGWAQALANPLQRRLLRRIYGAIEDSPELARAYHDQFGQHRDLARRDVLEQQVIAAAIQAAQDCTQGVRLIIGKRRDRSVARVIHSGARGTKPMQNNDAAGPEAVERSDWSDAFEAVSRLAAARELALQEIGRDQPEASSREPANAQPVTPSPAAASDEQVASLDPDQLACAVAEIEKASAVLRQSEPALEAWSPNSAAHGVKRKYWSIWLLVSGIWLSATLVVAGATGAILYLLS